MSSQSIAPPKTTRQQMFGPKPIMGNLISNSKVQELEDPLIKNFGKNIDTLTKNASVIGDQAKIFAQNTRNQVGFINQLFTFAKSSLGRLLFSIVGILLLGKLTSGTIGGTSSTLDPNTQFLMKSVSAWSYILCIILVLNYVFSLL